LTVDRAVVELLLATREVGLEALREACELTLDGGDILACFFECSADWEWQRGLIVKPMNYAGGCVLSHSFSVRELTAKTNTALTRGGHDGGASADQALAGLMKPNLVRALIQRGALR
jgi:hypothetical protein